MNPTHITWFALTVVAAASAIAASIYYASIQENVAKVPKAQSEVCSGMPRPSLEVPESKSKDRPDLPANNSRDPLRVSEPESDYGIGVHEPPEELTKNWQLNGVIQVGQDSSGESEWACSFVGKQDFYRVGDRLGSTEFTVAAIRFDDSGSSVEVEDKRGKRTKLRMYDLNRYK